MEEILSSLPEPMQLNYTAVIIAVMFLMFLLVLNALIFKPIQATMLQRQRIIDEGTDAQRKAQKTVDESLTEYKTSLLEARKKAQSLTLQISKETEMGVSQEISASKEKALAMVQAAVTEIDAQVARAKSSLKEDTQTLAQQIVASVLSRNAS